jgi:hypothetical protein
LFQRLKATIDLFYYEMSDFILSLGSPFEKVEGTNWYVIYSVNSGKAKGTGGEIGLEYLITSWLKGIFNYSYQRITGFCEVR